MSRRTSLWSGLGVLAGLAGCGGDSDTRVVTAVVAEGLNNPTAVIANADGTFLVAESGAGRIVSVGADGTVTPLVTGFEVGKYTPYSIGPLALLFGADGGLIVGEGGRPPGQDRVSFYGADGAETLTPLVPAGGGDFYGLAVQPSTGNLLIASASTDRLFGAPPVAEGGFGAPGVIISDTKETPISAAAPTALGFDPDGLLYMGFSGEGSSKIVRIDTATSRVQTVVETDSAVTGIAFRPSDARLFFTVLGDPERSSGAVYDIDTNGWPTPFAPRLAGPTSLTFDSSDALYVTTIGTPPNGTAGQLLKITVEVLEEPGPTTQPSNDNGG